jgi:hypothetical protein
MGKTDRKPFGQTKVGKFIKKTGIVGKLLNAGSSLAGKAVGGYTGNAAAGAAADGAVSKLADYAKQKGWGAHMTGHGINMAGKRGYGAKARKSKIIGSRRQVWHGSMQKTSGGLTKGDLMLNKRGRIVSKKKHAFGTTKGRQFLIKAGYDPKKGSFKLFPKKR